MSFGQFGHTGIDLPPWREPWKDPWQELFFADGIQADPPDGEPVFTPADSFAEPADDFIQSDAPDYAGQ